MRALAGCTRHARPSPLPALCRYIFYDGPPFATGLPHYGHILAGTIKASARARPRSLLHA